MIFFVNEKQKFFIFMFIDLYVVRGFLLTTKNYIVAVIERFKRRGNLY
jgi:hypothetical protein